MPTGVYKKTEEHRKKLSIANMGKPFHGKLPSFKGRKHSKESIEKNRLAHLGKKQSPELIEKRAKTLRGKKRKPFSKEWKDALSRSHKGIKRPDISGLNHPNWKGGVTSLNKKIRYSVEYKLWREAVFERDCFTCRWCGERGGELNADHIKPFALYPELRFAIDNGRTLCVDCHKKTDTYGVNLKCL